FFALRLVADGLSGLLARLFALFVFRLGRRLWFRLWLGRVGHRQILGRRGADLGLARRHRLLRLARRGRQILGHLFARLLDRLVGLGALLLLLAVALVGGRRRLRRRHRAVVAVAAAERRHECAGALLRRRLLAGFVVLHERVQLFGVGVDALDLLEVGLRLRRVVHLLPRDGAGGGRQHRLLVFAQPRAQPEVG